jgi:murein DD-endopeptidase MepM/ murein hydrolase activator NlpD
LPGSVACGADRPYGVGNHVVIRNGPDVYLVLGHMRCGGVRVACGERVRAGDSIGRVGNLGLDSFLVRAR